MRPAGHARGSSDLVGDQRPGRGHLATKISDDAIVLHPAGANLLFNLAMQGRRRVEELDKIIMSPGATTALLQLLADIRDRSMASSGLPDVPNDDDGEAWSRGEGIGTGEAASILGCSPRHARRLAHDGQLGTVRTVGNRLLVLRSNVDQAAAVRDT